MLDPKTLILRRLHEEEQTRRYGRRKRIERKLRQYRVETRDGVVIGKVYEGMATFETRTRGRMYVNSRWTSPRWYYDVDGSFAGYGRSYSETRKDALERLIETYTQERKDTPTP